MLFNIMLTINVIGSVFLISYCHNQHCYRFVYMSLSSSTSSNRDFETVNCVISDGDLLGIQRMPLKCFIWTKSASCEQFSIAHLFKILSWRRWQLSNWLKMEASWLPEWLLAGSEKRNWHNQVKAILCRNIHLLTFLILSSEGNIM